MLDLERRIVINNLASVWLYREMIEKYFPAMDMQPSVLLSDYSIIWGLVT